MVWVYNQQNDTWYQRGRTAITGTQGLPAPVATFNLTTTGLTVNLDASGSSQTGGTITGYAWDFGDSTTGTGVKPSHTYAAAGSYVVTLVVTGSSTLQAQTSRTFSVTVPPNIAPTADFTFTQGTGSDSLRANFYGTNSNDPDGTVTKWHWDFGNGQTYDATRPQADGFYYSSGGTYTVTLTVTDDDGATGTVSKKITVVGVNTPPTASITNAVIAADMRTVTVTYTSADSDGYIQGVNINWGDGKPVTHFDGTASTPPPTTAGHVYDAAGSYTIVATVTDNSGATAQGTKPISLPVISVGGTQDTNNLTPYNIGTPSDNIPSTVRIYTFADLGLTAATTNVQTVVDKLPGRGIIKLPNGYQGVIPNFNHHGTDTTGSGTRPIGYGIYNTNFQGFLGDMSNGKPAAKISMAANAMSANQLAAFGRRASGGTPTGTIAIKSDGNFGPMYFAGVEFDGADQQTVTDGATKLSGPAGWTGFSLNNLAAGSIMQNLYLRGFGRANMTAPPGENGMWAETYSTNTIFRRSELDGRLPGSTTRASGGLMWNAASYVLEDVYLHDAAWSGYTSSFTSMPKSSHDYTTRRLHVEHNSNHGLSGDNFSGINEEFNYGTIHHYQPRISRDTYGGDAGHVRQWVYNANLGTADKNANIIFHQPKWDSAPASSNGCFTITMVGYSAGGGGFRYPTVYLTNDETKPATPYVSTANVPTNITTANNYYVLRLA
jgi:PKD repeat protein